jgi:flagellar biosynthesis protein FlhB
MSESEDDSSKTEEPSAKKLEDYGEKLFNRIATIE